MVFTTVSDKEEDYQLLAQCVPPLQLESATATNCLDHLTSLHIGSRPSILRLSGIICVIGKASREPHIIEELIETGMNIACLDFGHGNHKYHTEALQNIRNAANSHNKKIGMTCSLGIGMLLKGAVIHTNFPIGGHSIEITLKEGDIVKLTGDAEYILKENKENYVHVTYENIHNVVNIGTEIAIYNRRILLKCSEIEGIVITCKVIKGGDLRSGLRVHLPGVPLDMPTLSEKDKANLQFAVEQDFDVIFPSYIRNAADVKKIRDFLQPNASDIMIVSQIENRQAVMNADEIIKASDGILLARGDLGEEMDETELFLAQKSIISRCNTVGKPVVVATQLLESMVKRTIPTRADRCDIANAIMDGTDCIMLHHETSVGDHPIECLQYTTSICKQAEAAVWQKQLVADLSEKITPPVITIHAMASATVQISLQLLASAVIVISSSLKSAQLLTQYRPKCPVLAVTRNEKKAKQVHLFRGILPLLYKGEMAAEWIEDVNLRISYGINFGRKKGFIRPGDPVIIMSGSRQGSGFTDRMRVIYITKHASHGTGCIC